MRTPEMHPSPYPLSSPPSAAMDPHTIPANLRALRAVLSLTQAQVASRAGVTLAQYRTLERGASEPSVDRLMRVADALGVPVAELFRPRLRLAHARFRVSGRVPRREDIVAAVSRQLDAYADLERILARAKRSSRKRLVLGRIRAALARRRDRGSAAVAMARTARRAFGIADGPVRDLCGLLEAHGVRVLTPEFAVPGFVGLSVREPPRGDAVVVNTWDRYSVEQWIFTAARELGHLILHADAYDVHDARPRLDEETEADQFASEFLMPDAMLHAEGRAKFGEAFHSAPEPDRVPPTAFDADRPDAPASQDPADLAQFAFANDRLTRRTRLAYERGLISIDRLAEIAGVPLVDVRPIARAWAVSRPS